MQELFTNIRKAIHGIDKKEQKYFMPFFYILFLAIGFIYYITVSSSPELKTPWRLVIFTILILLQMMLHWLFIRLAFPGKWVWYYLITQCLLAFGAIQLSQSSAAIFGLYLPLVGEFVGFKSGAISSSIGVFIVAAFLFGCMYQIQVWPQVGLELLVLIPMTAFVIIYVVLFKRQAEAREHAQNLLHDLEVAHEQLKISSEQIENLTLTNERQRMARELHDTLAQGIAGLILQLEAADSHLENNHPERARAIIQQSMVRARGTLTESRRVIDNLRAGISSSTALEEAIRRESEHFSIPCTLTVSLPDTLTEQECDTIHRIISEALTNIARHARASQSWITIKPDSGTIRIEIGDNGVGFIPVESVGKSGHYGLLGIQERVRMAGGTLEIVSLPGNGASLKISLPHS